MDTPNTVFKARVESALTDLKTQAEKFDTQTACVQTSNRVAHKVLERLKRKGWPDSAITSEGRGSQTVIWVNIEQLEESDFLDKASDHAPIKVLV